LRIHVLASGSSGNAALVVAKGTRVLVDAGIGPRTLSKKLEELGEGPPEAIVVTHAHQDHVGQCVKIARRLKIPVFASEATARCEALRGRDCVKVFGAREPFAVGAITVAPLPLPHDVAQVALTFADGEHEAGLATDLGEVPPGLLDHFARCRLLLLESNHDEAMLASGPYPAHLKRRIASARGHLSNAQAHALLSRLPAEAVTVVLMHLSRTNNLEALALASARDALAGRRVHLHAATQEGGLSLEVGAEAPRASIMGARRGQLSLF
jgi:phosphoribosyl 1,2-cyclic phosphodiesterase